MVNNEAISTKAKLLRIFRDLSGKKISGSSLASELGVSRVSIWKAVHELSTMGYCIQADKNGYTYTAQREDFLLPVEFGELEQLITYTDITSSTMDVAQHYALKGASSGSIFIAEEQTAGRGRKNRAWISRRGNLLFTLLIRPQKPLAVYYECTLAAQLALADVIQNACSALAVRIKWPNDVLIGNKKIAGILAEGMIQGDEFSWITIGVGVNIKSKINTIDAVCLSDVCHTVPQRAFFLKQFVVKFNEIMHSSTLRTHYEKQYALWKTNPLCSVRLSDGTVKKGEILKIDNYGQLYFCPLEQQGTTMVVSPADASLEV
ncbi:MAG TPA: biotin--[acetyl-CoA-carboxylase] ligase [Spirochaetia bacterium]|nr:biotin--[acetyl-CoA-carboxylase] ligase [Spirochaetales bacterium]HPD80855.1 biotin--[acetyl-CoA-carboxylase] ligase [Spirochaetales bacterium]HQK34466.1 biotin--[acetyl-CoA-carboxylase] ligase [Spirochaetales bacterium]HRS64625.1 biotin--[acetyl-CoA-carboxylase] ligase [Spirochaetia bacterium]HRV28003.1 biotin--[acetyl-CoA-carboxylase] ligase [Spirochaetia bacterium]